ncbi:MAG: MarR family transcriptional regulator [Chitinophagales bacterium]|nr:MarR family transcriptional regulator [Chitinophagales bacterium]
MMKIGEAIKQESFSDLYIQTEINVLYTAGWISNWNHKFYKQYDISQQQYNVLRILRGQHPKSAMLSLISERMIDKMSNATRLVEKLRLKNLVNRKTNPHNRRCVNISITQKGLDLLKEIDNQMNIVTQKYKTLTEEEAILLNDLLDKMRGNEEEDI